MRVIQDWSTICMSVWLRSFIIHAYWVQTGGLQWSPESQTTRYVAVTPCLDMLFLTSTVDTDNPHLVYAILWYHREFQRLATFTLNYGLAEIQRNMLAKASAGTYYRSCSPGRHLSKRFPCSRSKSDGEGTLSADV